MKYIITHKQTGSILLTDDIETLFDSVGEAEAYLRKHKLKVGRFDIRRYF